MREPSLDLAGYLVGQWYNFEGEAAQIKSTVYVSNNLYEQKGCNFLNVQPSSHVGALQSKGVLDGQNRALYEYLYRNSIWSGALALIDQPMDAAPDGTLLVEHAADLWTQEDKRDRARIFFERLCNTQWGRKHLSSDDVIEAMETADHIKAILKEMISKMPPGF